MAIKITSVDNPQIKEALRLQDRRYREESKLFIIEGYRELKRAFEGGVTLLKLFICPDTFLGINEPDLITSLEESGTAILECSEKVFNKISYRDRPDGLIGIGVQMSTTLAALGVQMKRPPLIVIAEGIEKPGNLGSIMRSADGVGADGVIVCDRCTDIYNPNVVRASVGTLFTIPVVEAGGGETFSWLKEHKIKIVSTSPQAKIEYTEADMRGPIAIVVGTEQLGLSEMWLNAADAQIAIPMKGVADSLNVATATTLLLYEVLRQRKPGFELGNNFLR